MAEHHFQTTRTARYYQLGELTETTHHLWVVCHGYGQLASYFSRNFAFLSEADPSVAVLAPEALSRFYLNGTGGRVGATWMTSDDRLREIDDHINYLTQLTGQALARCAADVKLTVLGFSQGTATVSRWLAQGGQRWPLANLILWAGDFPTDIPADATRLLLQGQRVTLVCGDNDQYVSHEKLEQQAAALRQSGAEVTVMRFAGGHSLNEPVLWQLVDQSCGVAAKRRHVGSSEEAGIEKLQSGGTFA